MASRMKEENIILHSFHSPLSMHATYPDSGPTSPTSILSPPASIGAVHELEAQTIKTSNLDSSDPINTRMMSGKVAVGGLGIIFGPRAQERDADQFPYNATLSDLDRNASFTGHSSHYDGSIDDRPFQSHLTTSDLDKLQAGNPAPGTSSFGQRPLISVSPMLTEPGESTGTIPPDLLQFEEVEEDPVSAPQGRPPMNIHRQFLKVIAEMRANSTVDADLEDERPDGEEMALKNPISDGPTVQPRILDDLDSQLNEATINGTNNRLKGASHEQEEMDKDWRELTRTLIEESHAQEAQAQKLRRLAEEMMDIALLRRTLSAMLTSKCM
ncbi:hypothetical protein DL93DRAFT_2081388 [Clavulina sp. PMI_390]|nr:hypothetical protein DL93DRAFT_2081388 [Clavulina sp. PMI_390]